MLNTYLKITVEKNGRSQNFVFISLNFCLRVSFLGAPSHAGVIEF